MHAETREEIVKHLPKLRRFALGLCGNREDADDLVQNACEKALTRLHQWEQGTRLDSWLFRIIQTTWIDQTRSRRLRGDSVDPDDLQHIADANAHRVPELRSSVSKLVETLQTLPEDQRSVIMLVCVEGHSYAEASEMLGIPVGTVMSRLSRGRLNLAEALDGPRPSQSNWSKPS
jgi:RNA polymerase sigma-70 factor (ECF subfamily)